MIKGLPRGVIDTQLKEATKEQQEKYIKIISLMTKLGHITWKESYTATSELYSTTVDNLEMEAHLGYDADTNVLYMYIEDLNEKVCAFYDTEYEQEITDIYTNMVTISDYNCWDEDTEISDSQEFVFGVDYDNQILGEVVKVFHLNINYNNDMLG